MRELFLLLLLLGAGFALGRASFRFWPKREPVAVQTGDPPPQVDSPSPAPAGTLDDLQSLADRIETCANAAAHIGEVEANADFLAAKAILAKPETPLDTVVSYAVGARFSLSYPALATLAERADRDEAKERILRQFSELTPWGMHFGVKYFEALADPPPIGALLLHAQEWWVGNQWIRGIFRDRLERGGGRNETVSFGVDHPWPGAEKAGVLRSFIAALDHPAGKHLLAELDEMERRFVDRDWLATVGRFWDTKDLTALAVAPEGWAPAIGKAPELLARVPARSLIAVGDAQTGKTTLLRLFADRVAGEGWQVFEAGTAELMAGQVYFGQLEERLRRIVREVTVEKKLVWYIPDLVQAARSGTHQGQAASVLDQILPDMNAGRIAIWTEATPAALARLLQMQPGLRNALEMVRIEPMDEEETRALAGEVASRLAARDGRAIEPAVVGAVVEAARSHLTHSSLPGAAIALLKLTARTAPEGAPLGPADVVATLSRLTGLPASILDASEKLDMAAIRAFFDARVMGQAEAVSAIVDRIAMLKAGLNDPGKPIGVFLFAGPTGTGKTELAKATAEFLFGSDDRMIRLDMSEFQTTDSLVKIIGDGTAGETGSLVARVRKQPFSLVLLDEFEKSHPNVWDLFLQVFDDARLTDAAGQTADFRHCIVILTSNLGATAHRTGGFGFSPPGDHFSSEQVMRAIAQTYRPEFQNRLDRVVVFQPLTRDLMRNILRKELDAVLARRGLKDRAWALEWEPSAIEFLLEKGFSPEMGARPVKRAIDQHLLAPLAAAIVERRFPEGEQFVFVRAAGNRLAAEFVDPDAPATSAATTPAGDGRDLAAIILAPRGGPTEATTLARHLDEVRAALADPTVEEIRTRLALAMAAPGFWTDAGRHRVLARYALQDRLQAALETAERLAGRLKGNPSTVAAREVGARLGLQLHLLGEGLRDLREDAPVEAVVTVEPALDQAQADRAPARGWCEEIVRMLRNWAEHRNMQFEEIALPGQPSPTLAIAGFGAFRTLAGEAGLHVLDGSGTGRIAARVIVVEGPLGDLPEARRRSLLDAAFAAAEKTQAIARRYRRDPAGVRQGSGPWRDVLKETLAGDFDLVLPRERVVPRP